MPGSCKTRGGGWLLLLLAVLLAAAAVASPADGGRRALKQLPPPLPSTTASAGPAQQAYASLSDALNAVANATPGATAKPSANLTILVAAVKKAGLINSSISPATAWTIFAPTNKAFEEKLPRLGLTPDALLSNSSLLLEILSYHVVPSGAYNSSSLTAGLSLTTALAGAPPLVVKIDGTKKDGRAREKPQIEIQGASNKAEVSEADIFAGKSVIHIVNDVLLPPGIRAAPKPASDHQKDHNKDDSE